MTARSWGNVEKTEQEEIKVFWGDAPLRSTGSGRASLLPYGLGRSYGDSCLNDGGALLLTRPLDHFLAFDERREAITCESGVSFAEVLDVIVPRGFFLPVTPGTKFVTVGGAVANDVHGKNHHGDGSFGNWVDSFELVRSSGERLVCSRTENSELFRATIGGLGLTGLIVWVKFRLKRVPSPLIAQETVRFGNVGEFLSLSNESTSSHLYSVAWVDCLARGRALGRGHFIRGNHLERVSTPVNDAASSGDWKKKPEAWSPSVPFNFPSMALSRATMSAFNWLYYHRQRQSMVSTISNPDSFFYPLDSILHWNRIYGRRGFFQHQCVVPHAAGREAIEEIIGRVAHCGAGSFLAVLKVFGEVPSEGIMSFPRPGITLALDLPNTGERVLSLMRSLDDVVLAAGGAIYPAKDARMSPEMFRCSFPRLEEFKQFVDPRFSSTFWRRVTGEEK